MPVAEQLTRWRSGCMALLLFCGMAHVVWNGLRLVQGGVVKRARRIAAFHEQGPVHYHLDAAWLGGADGLEWVLAHTGPDAVVLFQGEERGAMEFAAALLAPRLLVQAGAVAPGQRTLLVGGRSRKVAGGALPSGAVTGQWVLTGRPDGVELGAR